MIPAEYVAQAAVGLGVLVAGIFSGWQAFRARKQATHAAENTRPVANGFAAEVTGHLEAILLMATEARDAATRADDKIDRHLEAHANAQVIAHPHTIRRSAP